MKKRTRLLITAVVLLPAMLMQSFLTVSVFAAETEDETDQSYEYGIPSEIIPEENVELYGHIDDNKVYSLWTNHSSGYYCQQNSAGEHKVWTSPAVGLMDNKFLMILSMYGVTEAEKEAFVSVAIAHETVHNFGMDDVYDDFEDHGVDENGNTIGVENYNCIMKVMPTESISAVVQFYLDVVNNGASPLCDDCKRTLLDTVYGS